MARRFAQEGCRVALLARSADYLDRLATEITAARYDEFRKRFCELDDGHAAQRVVDTIFVE